ncbi:hypothetical protein CL622_08515 [archaeon]|nr:hypothetical protein [archaeon]
MKPEQVGKDKRLFAITDRMIYEANNGNDETVIRLHDTFFLPTFDYLFPNFSYKGGIYTEGKYHEVGLNCLAVATDELSGESRESRLQTINDSYFDTLKEQRRTNQRNLELMPKRFHDLPGLIR